MADMSSNLESSSNPTPGDPSAFVQISGNSDASAEFVDRRRNSGKSNPGSERRQFGNSYTELSPEARELALAVDNYKLQHRRRFVSYEELLAIMKSLGYDRD